jgi:class 3 adenylate cyclase/tetratricopeptide (TPR) repeat protein/ABC-type dipeptide/oligopeptide/nickel transport system ATPase component
MQMVKCPGCGEENPAKFRLCGYCGTPLAPAPAPLPAHEVRKTVTLIFTDLKDSTALGERLDSEAMHEVKERYFNAMAAEIQRHGGKIEKYIGDAIMAVFGLPRANEDDALRAVRSAVGMQQVLRTVNEDLKKRFGVELANRTGVNTGEVVATDDPTRDQKLATGDAVNVTARLEAAAPANEIYIGETTYRLVRDAVTAEAVEPLTLKGKSEPVPAFRLIAVHGEDGNVRRHDSSFVGREPELEALDTAWREVLSQRRPRLVTVIGDAGVGKTRLVREIMKRLSAKGARIVGGRCLAYGEGITFWPLRGMVLSAAGVEPDDTPEQARAKILACVGDKDVADRLASASGLSSTSYSVQDINWGARRFLQALAADAPVVALFDDIHWAEPALLDLIRSLLGSIEDAPVLLLATARHELLESVPDWGEGDGARRLVLQPLDDSAVAQVVANLLGSAGVPEALVARVVRAAEGNPLYVEQMLSMLVDSGVVKQEDGKWVATDACADIAIPPTIHALLEARLDKLDRTERATAEPASVIGLEFQKPAVQSLSPPPVRDAIDEKLKSLSRKHFIRSAVGTEGHETFRFDHHLVRDTVYNGLLKRARATMHVEFVKWADQANAGSDRGREFEEILGYHLEQAYKYLGELGPIDEQGEAIGRDGARRLASAARRALDRGDMHAAAGLYRRAAALLPALDPERVELLPELSEALMGLGDFVAARAAVNECYRAAEAISNSRLKAKGRLVSWYIGLLSGEQGNSSEQALQISDEVIPLLEREGADRELATAWLVVVLYHGIAGRYSLASEAALRSIEHARKVGDQRLVAKAGANLVFNALLGATPVAQGIAECEELIAGGLGNRQIEGKILLKLAQLRAMNGEIAEARSLCQRGRSILRDLGQSVNTASTGSDLALVESLGGDLACAEREVRADLEFLASVGETYYRSTLTALLSRLVRDQGRDDEALELSKVAEELTADDDMDSIALWRSIRAPIIARKGDVALAEELARSAYETVRESEALQSKADALFELASVLRIAGKDTEARQTVSEALALFSAKGDVVSAARLASWLNELDGRTSLDP